jgi:hypothetical protein
MFPVGISEFLSAADKALGLLKSQQVRRREYFEKIIDPVYTQFAVAGEDYLKLFREARNALEMAPKRISSSKKLKLVSQIRDRREEFLAGRLKVRAMVEAFGSHVKQEQDRELYALLHAIDKFFFGSGYRRDGGSSGAYLIDFFSLWATRGESNDFSGEHEEYTEVVIGGALQAQRYGADDLTQFVRDTIDGLETAWFEAAGRYADLRLKYLGNKIL